ncbi:hypothetical protein NEAUS03_2147, partial [Nematocida ausubeli]
MNILSAIVVSCAIIYINSVNGFSFDSLKDKIGEIGGSFGKRIANAAGTA